MSSWQTDPGHHGPLTVLPVSRDDERAALRALERAGALELAPMLGLEVDE